MTGLRIGSSANANDGVPMMEVCRCKARIPELPAPVRLDQSILGKDTS